MCGDCSGFTWGVDGKKRFPPNRLDKVAMLSLKPVDLEVLHPGTVLWMSQVEGHSEAKDVAKTSGDVGGVSVAWSDHSGLQCSFEVLN